MIFFHLLLRMAPEEENSAFGAMTVSCWRKTAGAIFYSDRPQGQEGEIWTETCPSGMMAKAEEEEKAVCAGN